MEHENLNEILCDYTDNFSVLELTDSEEATEDIKKFMKSQGASQVTIECELLYDNSGYCVYSYAVAYLYKGNLCLWVVGLEVD